MFSALLAHLFIQAVVHLFPTCFVTFIIFNFIAILTIIFIFISQHTHVHSCIITTGQI